MPRTTKPKKKKGKKKKKKHVGIEINPILSTLPDAFTVKVRKDPSFHVGYRMAMGAHSVKIYAMAEVKGDPDSCDLTLEYLDE